MFHSDTVIQLFAKEPVLGRVKTRMQDHLSPSQALSLHGELTRWMCCQLCTDRRAEVEMWVAGKPQHPFFQALVKQWDIPMQAQSDGDLGEKMYDGACTGLQRKRFVILVGSDCPFVNGTYLEDAINALHNGNDIVFGPARDGGYVLLGLRAVDKTLFEDIPWGESQVLAITEQRVAALGWRYHRLAEQVDIDRPEDLSQLEAETLPASLREFASLYP